MNLVLHIGMEKTGSTAIQHWLNIERLQLCQEGWHIPSTLGKTNHRQLALLGFDPDHRDDATQNHKVETNDDMIRLQQEIKTRLKKEIHSAMKSKCNTIIASSELISSRLRKQSEKNRLLRELKETGFENIKVVIFVRDPADLAESRHSTAILHEGRTEAHPPMPHTYEADLFSKQSKLIKDWQSASKTTKSGARVITIQYETAMKNNKSSCCGLAEALQMSNKLYNTGKKTSKNKSLPAANLRLIRITNAIKNNYPQCKKNRRIEKILEGIVGIIKGVKITNKAYRMPTRLRVRYNVAYQNSVLTEKEIEELNNT